MFILCVCCSSSTSFPVTSLIVPMTSFPFFWIPLPCCMCFLLAFQLFPVLLDQSPSPLLSGFSLDIFFLTISSYSLQIYLLAHHQAFCKIVLYCFDSSVAKKLGTYAHSWKWGGGGEGWVGCAWPACSWRLALECLVGCQWFVKHCTSNPKISSYKYLSWTHTYMNLLSLLDSHT